MKRFETVTKIAAMALVIMFTFPAFTDAFHEGGNDYCAGCHGFDRREGGAAEFMLKGLDASSTCLRCHSEKNDYYNILSNDGSSYTAGGDFYWSSKTYSWMEDGRPRLSSGENHGHNVVAAEKGMVSDGKLNTAPGGLYPAAELGCTSCHDPHERSSGSTGSGNFRLLGGAGYQAPSGRTDFSFQLAAPVAKSDPIDWAETDSRHTAYGSGMSEWCTNCHADYLSDGSGAGSSTHPAGNQVKLNNGITSNYNSYIRTGDFTGTRASAYLALVPFETGTANSSLLDPTSSEGPDGDANVMCLTCHRAHASAFANMGRWDFSTTFIAASHPQQGDGGVSGNDVLNSYYGRNTTAEFGKYQRQFCNKCHVRD